MKTCKKFTWVIHPRTHRRGIVKHVYPSAEVKRTELGRLVLVDFGSHESNHRESTLVKSSDQQSKWVEKPFEY